MRFTTAALVATAASLGAALALSACTATGEPGAAAATNSSGAVATTPTTATPTATQTETSSRLPTGADSAASSGPPSPSAVGGTTTSKAVAHWPKALGEPQQGDPVWAVYLAVGHSASDPVIEGGLRDAAKVGYQAVVGDIACDGGAMEALGLDQYDYWSGASLYFGTESDARSFASAFTAKVRAPRGLAKVNVGCLD